MTLAEKSLNKRITQIFEEYKAMLEAEGGIGSQDRLDNENSRPQILTQSDNEGDDMMD